MTVMKGVFCPQDEWTQVADATTYQAVTATVQDTSSPALFWIFIGDAMPTSVPKDGFTDGVRLCSTQETVRGWTTSSGDFTGTDKLFVCPDESRWFNVVQW